MSWSAPSWKEAAIEYAAHRTPTRVSEAEFRRWRIEAGFDDGRAADSHRTQETTTPITKF
jgi:hypothetical protein